MSVLRPIPAPQVPAIWPVVRELVERGLRHAGGRWRPSDVLASLESRDRQLWLLEDAGGLLAVTVTEIAVYPRRKVCLIFLVAGRHIPDWRERLAEIAAWAKAEGCAEMELRGRKGWRRLLPAWRGESVLLTREL